MSAQRRWSLPQKIDSLESSLDLCVMKNDWDRTHKYQKYVDIVSENFNFPFIIGLAFIGEYPPDPGCGIAFRPRRIFWIFLFVSSLTNVSLSFAYGQSDNEKCTCPCPGSRIRRFSMVCSTGGYHGEYQAKVGTHKALIQQVYPRFYVSTHPGENLEKAPAKNKDECRRNRCSRQV